MPDTPAFMRAGAGFSTAADPHQAGEEAAKQAVAGAGRVDAALVFAGPGYGDGLPMILDAVTSALGTEVVAGASAHGVLAAGHECEGEAAVAILALGDAEAEAFLVADPAGEEEAAADEIAARLGQPRPEDLVVLLPDPGNFDSTALLPALAERLGPAVLVGAGAGDTLGDAPLQWGGRTVATGAISALVVRGRRPPRVGVTQACRPLTELTTVTRSRGHWLLEIDGRPALDVFREAAGAALADDLRRAAQFVLVAVPAPGAPDDSLTPGSYLVRHVVGLEEDANAFAIPVEVRPGDRIAFAFRDASAAREDLKAMLDAQASNDACAALYLNCCARGEAFFGVAGLEAAYLDHALGRTPVAGMFGSFEIGPVGQATELLSYTGVLALLDG